MTDWFVLGDAAAGHLQRARLTEHGTGSATVRTGHLFAECLGLLFQEGGQGALGEAGGGGVGELLQGLEIGVPSRAVSAVGAAGNDFAPASSKVTDFLEEFRGKFTA